LPGNETVGIGFLEIKIARLQKRKEKKKESKREVSKQMSSRFEREICRNTKALARRIKVITADHTSQRKLEDFNFFNDYVKKSKQSSKDK
jgi:hypothetical protein